MRHSWHTSEPHRPAVSAERDQFVGGDNPARANAALRELIKVLAREIAAEDHLAEKDQPEDR